MNIKTLLRADGSQRLVDQAISYGMILRQNLRESPVTSRHTSALLPEQYPGSNPSFDPRSIAHDAMYPLTMTSRNADNILGQTSSLPVIPGMVLRVGLVPNATENRLMATTGSNPELDCGHRRSRASAAQKRPARMSNHSPADGEWRHTAVL